ncbi:hypothetical protein D3C78_1291250 [compost metagenome]
MIAMHMPNVDQGFIGHQVRVYHVHYECAFTLPIVTAAGLAGELAELLRADLPDDEVSVTPYACFSEQRAEADRVTASIEAMLSELRDTDHPGLAFLRRIGLYASEENAA